MDGIVFVIILVLAIDFDKNINFYVDEIIYIKRNKLLYDCKMFDFTENIVTNAPSNKQNEINQTRKKVFALIKDPRMQSDLFRPISFGS